MHVADRLERPQVLEGGAVPGDRLFQAVHAVPDGGRAGRLVEGQPGDHVLVEVGAKGEVNLLVRRGGKRRIFSL